MEYLNNQQSKLENLFSSLVYSLFLSFGEFYPLLTKQIFIFIFIFKIYFFHTLSIACNFLSDIHILTQTSNSQLLLVLADILYFYIIKMDCFHSNNGSKVLCLHKDFYLEYFWEAFLLFKTKLVPYINCQTRFKMSANTCFPYAFQ